MRPEHRLPESSIVVRPEPMESATYTASSRLQAAGLLPAVALFEQAAAQVPLPTPPQPIVIADYGAATGHNSLTPMSAAIAVLRRRTRHDHAILVAHTDVPDNDFTALFRTLADDHDSYLSHDASSFPAAIGRSFYGQILPSNTVNLGWSSWAVQWLSRVPAGAPELRRTEPGRGAAGANWIGLQRRHDHLVTGIAATPLLPPWLTLPLILGLAVLAWRREGA